MSDGTDLRNSIRSGPLRDLYDAIFEKISASASDTTPDQLAFSATMGIKERLGGQTFYIPMDHTGALKKRKLAIYEFWENSNASIQDVAVKFGVVQTIVYDVISSIAKQNGSTGKILIDLRNERNAKIYSAWKGGVSVCALSEKFDIDQSVTRCIIQSFSNERSQEKP
ncbi:hypothetical protein QEM14_003858 [Pseudomonas putida]|nr:hypothetical protein [Pseudomonas putida]